MTDLDLTEATEACWRAMDPNGFFTRQIPRLEVGIAAAVEVIERQIRERIAADIEAKREWHNEHGSSSVFQAGLTYGARIARGGAL